MNNKIDLFNNSTLGFIQSWCCNNLEQEEEEEKNQEVDQVEETEEKHEESKPEQHQIEESKTVEAPQQEGMMVFWKFNIMQNILAI